MRPVVGSTLLRGDLDEGFLLSYDFVAFSWVLTGLMTGGSNIKLLCCFNCISLDQRSVLAIMYVGYKYVDCPG